MQRDLTFVLMHSPLVGPFTWELVARELDRRGIQAVLPTLSDRPDSTLPFWQQHAESVARELADVPATQSLVLVAHSGAGPLLAALRRLLNHRIAAYIFVDAGIPRDNASRLDMMKWEDAEWAAQFQGMLEHGGQFPTWSADDLREIVPDEAVRQRLVSEIHPRALPFFIEPIPAFADWPDAPCAYIHFSAPYNRVAAYARQAGWLVRELSAGHFHMLVDAVGVTELLLAAIQQLSGYDPIANEYAEKFIDELQHKPFDRELLDRFADRVRALGPVCDLGCGPGQVARYLHERGVDAFGVDASQAMVEVAQQLNPHLRFEQGDMRALNAANGAWAGIAAFYSIIHIPHAQVINTLRELKRVLRPEGLLLLAFHVGDQIVHVDEWWGKPVWLNGYFFTLDEMQGFLRQAGFEIEQALERAPYEPFEGPTRRGYILARKLHSGA